MSRFKIGQKVVCVKSHSLGFVIKGKIYTVHEKSNCTCIAIYVGISQGYTSGYCCNCKKIITSDKAYIHESLFAPIKEDGSSLSLTLEIDIEEFEIETMELN